MNKKYVRMIAWEIKKLPKYIAVLFGKCCLEVVLHWKTNLRNRMWKVGEACLQIIYDPQRK